MKIYVVTSADGKCSLHYNLKEAEESIKSFNLGKMPKFSEEINGTRFYVGINQEDSTIQICDLKKRNLSKEDKITRVRGADSKSNKEWEDRHFKIIKKLTDLKKDWKYYKKKPVIIKATELEEDEVWIETREGILKAYKGDFIIQGIEGEIYPCAKDIFFKTYEEEENGI